MVAGRRTSLVSQPSPAPDGNLPLVTVAAYPGTFDPPTIAHLAVAEAAWRACEVDRVELVLSVDPIGKGAATPLDVRIAAIEAVCATRRGCRWPSTEHRLIADVCRATTSSSWAPTSGPRCSTPRTTVGGRVAGVDGEAPPASPWPSRRPPHRGRCAHSSMSISATCPPPPSATAEADWQAFLVTVSSGCPTRP